MSDLTSGSAPVEIELDDKIDPKIAPKILEIAEAAREADAAVERLRAQITGLDGSKINSLTAAISKQNAAYLQQETLLNKAVKAESDAATAHTRLTGAINNTVAAELNAESAFNRALLAENKVTAASVTREEKLVAEAKALQAAADAQAFYNSHLGIGGPSAASGGATYSALQQQAAAEKALGTEQAKLTASNAKFLTSLESQASTLGMTRSEMLAYRAEQLGLSAQAAPMIAKFKAIEEAENEVSHGASGMSLATRESVTLMREAINGNYTRMVGSSTLLAQATGVLKYTFTLEGAAVLSVAAAVGTLLVAMSKGQSQEAEYNNLLRATGQFAGYTYGSLKQLEQEVSNRLNVTLGTSADVFRDLAASGRVSGKELDQIGESSIKLGQLTGENATSIANDFLKMQSGVSNYAYEFNSKYHLLTAAQLDYIHTLEEQGRKEEAERQLASDVYNAIKNVAVEQLGFIERKWLSLKQTVSGVWDYMESLGRAATPQENVITDLTTIAKLKAQLKTDMSGDYGPFSPIARANAEAELKAAQDKLHWDKLSVDAAEQGAKWQAESVKNTQEANDASQKLDGTINALAKGSDLFKQHLRDVRSELQTIEKFDPTNPKVALMADPSKKSAQFPLGDLKDSVIDNLKKKFDPADVKAENEAATAAERHASAIEKINVALTDEQERMNMLKPVRDAQAIADRYEVGMAGQKIKMSDAEKAAILEKAKAIVAAKEVQQEEDVIYNKLRKPMDDYQNKLRAINILLQQNAIDQREANAQKMAATIALAEATNPIGMEIGSLKAEQQQLTLLSDAREVETKVYDAWLAAQKSGIPVTDEQLQQLRDTVKATQNIRLVSQQLDTIYKANAGAVRDLAARVVALNLAYTGVERESEAYKLQMMQVGQEALRLKIQMGQADFSDVLLSGLGKVIDGYKGLMPTLAEDFGNFFNSIATQGSAAIGAIITKTETLQEGIHQVSTAILSDFIGALVKLGIQWVIQQTLGDTLAAAATASSTVMAGEMAAAWEPAAMAASIATFGGADAIGASAYLTALAAGKIGSMGIPGFAGGGLIGGAGMPRADDKLIRVSSGEFMVQAAAVTPQTLPILTAINGGMGDPYNWLDAARVHVPHYADGGYVRAAANPSVGKMPVYVTQHGGQEMEYDATMYDDRIEIIATQVADKRIKKNVPLLLGKEINNENSPLSKGIERHTHAKRKH